MQADAEEVVMSVTLKCIIVVSSLMFLSACQAPNEAAFFQKPLDFLSSQSEKLKTFGNSNSSSAPKLDNGKVEDSLENILDYTNNETNLTKGFVKSLKAAVMADPFVMAANNEVNARIAGVEANNARKEFQLDGKFYGGVEDVSDETAGAAYVLSANRVIFDGGKIDAQIAVAEQQLAASRHSLRVAMDERATKLLNVWIELDRYEQLDAAIKSRMRILTPLIGQLQKVADAGVGDVSQVAAAKRTVNSIRVTQTEVEQSLAQTRVEFENAFGALPAQGSFNDKFIKNSMPKKITTKLANSSPSLLEQYANYLVAEAELKFVQARDDFDIGFEAMLSRPLGDSSVDSKESIGFVLRKNFYDGGQLAAEERQAVARVKSAMAKIRAVHQDGDRIIKASLQTISSMDKAINLSRENAAVTRSEIEYLRKQLVIGGSTLDTVLAAEARLYEAESKEINFQANKLKAQTTILSVLGILSKAIGLNELNSNN